MNNDNESPVTRIEDHCFLKSGDLVVICERYRKLMSNPREGYAGYLPYTDPGRSPGIIIKTWPLNGRHVAQVLWPDGRIAIIESQFLSEPMVEDK